MAIGLRAVEPQDIDFIESIENNQAFWKVSETQLPFSRYQIKQYIENAHIDIYSAKQYRFIIYIKSINVSVGIIDFYDFNPKNKRIGIGIVIDIAFQGKGYAKEAICLLLLHAKNQLLVHQVYAKIQSSNLKSSSLFEKCGFKHIATLKDWYFDGKTYEDELLMRFIITD